MSLAGGSGWCVLVYNLHTRSLHNHWAWDHMHGAIAGVPLLALDMYEHSFHMDYGTAAAKYVDAFFRNIDWEVVDRRSEEHTSELQSLMRISYAVFCLKKKKTHKIKTTT